MSFRLSLVLSQGILLLLLPQDELPKALPLRRISQEREETAVRRGKSQRLITERGVRSVTY